MKDSCGYNILRYRDNEYSLSCVSLAIDMVNGVYITHCSCL